MARLPAPWPTSLFYSAAPENISGASWAIGEMIVGHCGNRLHGSARCWTPSNAVSFGEVLHNVS